MRRWFWRVMEHRYIVWGSRFAAGYMVVFTWLVILGSQL